MLERFAAAARGNRVVQMKYIDVVHLQALQAAIQGVADRLSDGSGIRGRNTNLGADSVSLPYRHLRDFGI